jgi:hypothetical protein
MLVVAAFCFGWVCKERWDGTPLSTLLANQSQTEPLVKALAAECDRQLEEIAKRLLDPAATQGDLHSRSLSQEVESSLHQTEIILSVQTVNLLSAELERLENARHKALFPSWFPGSLVGGSLLVSMWVISCVVAMRLGVRISKKSTNCSTV